MNFWIWLLYRSRVVSANWYNDWGKKSVAVFLLVYIYNDTMFFFLLHVARWGYIFFSAFCYETKFTTSNQTWNEINWALLPEIVFEFSLLSFVTQSFFAFWCFVVWEYKNFFLIWLFCLLSFCMVFVSFRVFNFLIGLWKKEFASQ